MIGWSHGAGTPVWVLVVLAVVGAALGAGLGRVLATGGYRIDSGRGGGRARPRGGGPAPLLAALWVFLGWRVGDPRSGRPCRRSCSSPGSRSPSSGSTPTSTGCPTASSCRPTPRSSRSSRWRRSGRGTGATSCGPSPAWRRSTPSTSSWPSSRRARWASATSSCSGLIGLAAGVARGIGAGRRRRCSAGFLVGGLAAIVHAGRAPGGAALAHRLRPGDAASGRCVGARWSSSESWPERSRLEACVGGSPTCCAG